MTQVHFNLKLSQWEKMSILRSPNSTVATLINMQHIETISSSSFPAAGRIGLDIFGVKRTFLDLSYQTVCDFRANQKMIH